MWINPETNQVFKLHSEIRNAFPEVSFPSTMSDNDIAFVGVLPVTSVVPPGHNPITQELRELAPVATPSGHYEQRWEVVALSPEQIAANQLAADEAMVKACDKALTDHLDAVARTRRYDNRITCAVRAGYPGPFQAEGEAFALWMDTCNALAYQLLAEIQAGTHPLPTDPQQLIAELPAMEWPQ